MPPFGNLYDMEVYVAESLAEDKEIAFNNGNHTEMLKLSFADYERLVQPRIFKFSKKEVSFQLDREDRWGRITNKKTFRIFPEGFLFFLIPNLWYLTNKFGYLIL